MQTSSTIGDGAVDELVKRLEAHYGPTGWWPGELPFEVMIGAILVQNTAWSNAERAIGNLREAGLLDARALATTDVEAVKPLIRPSGYYNQKGERIHALARWIVEEFAGDTSQMADVPVATMRELLLDRPGVGPETADSILCYALDHPVFVADAYTRRIFARHGVATDRAPYGELQSRVMDFLPPDRSVFADLHAHIVFVGKDFCTPRSPDCRRCPLNGWHQHDSNLFCE